MERLFTGALRSVRSQAMARLSRTFLVLSLLAARPAVAVTIVTALLSATIRVRRHRDRPRTFRLDPGRERERRERAQFAAYLDGTEGGRRGLQRGSAGGLECNTAAVDDLGAHARACSLLPVRRSSKGRARRRCAPGRRRDALERIGIGKRVPHQRTVRSPRRTARCRMPRSRPIS